METVGVVVGVVALAGLFSTCLDIMSTISSCQAYGETFELLKVQLDIEHFLFHRWGEAVGLTSSQCDPRFQDDHIRVIICRILSCMVRKFEDANALTARYQVGDEDVPRGDTPARSQTLSRRMQEETSLGKKSRWAVHDRAKFETLIKEIRVFNESLNRLLPIQQRESSDYQLCWSEAAPRRVSDATSIPLSDLTTEVGSTNDVEDWLERTVAVQDDRMAIISPIFERFLARVGGNVANMDDASSTAIKTSQATTPSSRHIKGKSTNPQFSPPNTTATRPHPLSNGSAVDCKTSLMSHTLISPPKIKLRKQVSSFVRSIVIRKVSSQRA